MSAEEYVTGRLKELCEKKHMSRYRLSIITGVSQTAVANIFTGKSTPTISTLSLMCDAFGISLAQFFMDGADAGEAFPGLSDQQRKLLEAWEELGPEKRQMLVKFIESIR